MSVVNIHERVIDLPAEKVGELIDGLASENDLLWPHDRWPAMTLDVPLQVGAKGGHGPIGYYVESYDPGKNVQFRFTSPSGFSGTHSFDIEELGEDQVVLRHVIEMKTGLLSGLMWGLVFRPLHDALIEDAFDRAEIFAGGNPPMPEWSEWVKFLRRQLKKRAAREGGDFGNG